MTLKIWIVNHSTVMTNAELIPIAAAIQLQARRHVAPYYGTDYQCYITVQQSTNTVTTGPNVWSIGVYDDSDQAGALGYHETTNGYPSGKVFAATDKKYGLSVSVTLSHEICEMLGDPYAIQGYQLNTTTWGAWELCDPCEADQLGYKINGVLVSDFVLPAWFNGGPGPYTFNNTIGAPMTLAAGGYMSLWSEATGWTQQTAELAGVKSRSETMSRHGERALGSYMKAVVPVSRPVEVTQPLDLKYNDDNDSTEEEIQPI